jgi:LPXTG-motif cell wall-anchored protein
MTFFRLTSRLVRIVTLGAVGLLLVAAVSVAIGSPASAATAVTVTFEVSGAQGGAGGGGGAIVTGTATLDAGTDVEVYVGGTNGFNGGGAAGTFVDGPGMSAAGNGGGASDLRIGGSTLGDRVLVGGGGGGAGGGWLDAGMGGPGGGGDTTGLDGSRGSGGAGGFGGTGATATTAGSGGAVGTGLGGTAGVDGSGATGGAGGDSAPSPNEAGAGGGGGGGWFGGGGGGGTCCLNGGGGGGGGSNHVDAMFTGVSSTAGARGGNGRVRISLDGGTTWVTTFGYTGAPQTYTVPEPPHPGSINPIAGPTGGGTDVTLTGTDLTDTSSVLVCGNAATNLVVVSDTEVTFSTPAGSVGSCDVTVQTHASGTATLDAAFRYFAVPVVTSVDPDNGPSAGGTPVTIHGSGFTGAGAPTFGGTTASNVDVVDDTTITATTPAHAAGAVDVVVTTPDASGTATDAFTYNAPPSSLTVAPSSGPIDGGTDVTLTGTDLTDTTAVLVCGQAAGNLDVVSDTEVDFTTPAGDVGSCDVIVETTASGTTTVTNGFRYFAVPAVTSVDPGEGPIAGGTAVTVHGSGFTGATSVTFGGTAATEVTVVDDTTLTATAPAHAAGSVDVVVTTPDASGTGTDAFTYDAAASSLTVSPVAGPAAGGTTITISGEGLATTSGVTVGGAAATDVTVQDDTTVTAVVPAGAVGEADVVVTTMGGSTTLTDAFTYTESADLGLGAKSAMWGAKLDVSGRGFDPGSEVTLTLHSAPVVLGTVSAGDDGRFTTTVTIPVIEPGDHVLTADGVDALGQPLTLQAAVTVTPDPAMSGTKPIVTGSTGAAPSDDPSSGSLPKTGADPAGPLLAGLLLVVLGSGICVTRRRRLS